MSATIIAAEVPSRWADILAALRKGEQEYLIAEGRQIRAVIMDHAHYRRLVALALREQRRQRALALPLAAAESSSGWDNGFEVLDRISAKFSELSDEDLEALFGAALSEIHADDQA